MHSEKSRSLGGEYFLGYSIFFRHLAKACRKNVAAPILSCPRTVFYFLLFPSAHRHFPCGTALDGRLGWEPWLGSPSQGSGLHSAQTPAEASASQEMFRFPWVTFRRGHRRPARDQGNNRQRRLSFLIPPSCRIFTNKDEVVVFGMSKKKIHQRYKSSQFIVTCENTYMLNHKLGCQNSFFFLLLYVILITAVL